MPLKAKIANKVQTNENGLVEGTILHVLEISKKFEDSKGNEISEQDYLELKKLGKKVNRYDEQFEFQIQAEGTQKNIIYHVWTNVNFNDEKFEKEDGNSDYNKFTRLMLQLEAIKESELKELNKLSEFDIESLQGLKITFELEPSKKGNGMKTVKLTSIKPMKV